jgi:hypothetical protein
MNKIVISFSKLVLLSFAMLAFASCRFDGITGSGHVTTQTRNVEGDFTGVEANSGMDVVVEQSDVKSVVVEADDNIQEHIITKVENGILKISSDKSGFMNVKKMKVTVKTPIIKSIEAGGGSSLTSMNVIKSDEISIKADSGSSIEMNVESDKIISESGSGSTINLSGKALTYDSSSSSGSTTESGKLLANEVTAQASSGSSIEVNAIVKLVAKASSGASVDYVGTPKSLTKEENSGGSVSGK